ncbi:hypothetical protein [Jatrophihabitans sp.]|jgi:hypothetical protein|uniref:hypothetical protein n=1 Tax=Jatrophihabitans sp. TaxID=1932789 RepID=UPI002EF2A866
MKVVEFAVRLGLSARALRRRSSLTSEPTAEETFSDPFRWQTVTILAAPQEIARDGRLPEPLAELAEFIDIRIEPAPGDRGSQLSARTKLAHTPDSTLWKGKDLSRQVHSALRHAKQLIEVGEVLSVEPQPAGKRRQPATGLLMELTPGDADQEGVL